MTTVYRAINKPMVLLGLDRRILGACVLSAMASYVLSGRSLRVALLVGLVLYFVAKHVTKKDPDYPFLLWSLWRQKRRYDPIMRNSEKPIIIIDAKAK